MLFFLTSQLRRQFFKNLIFSPLVFHHFQTHFLIPVENTLSPANYLVPSLSRKVFVFSKHPAPLCLLRKSSRFVMKFVFIPIRWKERERESDLRTRNHRLTSPSIAIWTKDYLPLREDPRRPETVFVKRKSKEIGRKIAGFLERSERI